MKSFFARRALVPAIVMLAVAAAQAQDPWGQADDVPTYQPGDSWTYNRTFTISLGGVLAQNVGLPGLNLLVDGALDFQDVYELEVDATPTAVVNSGFRGFDDTLAYVRNRISGTLTLTGANARLSLNTLPGEFADIVMTLSTLDSSSGINHVGISDLSQIREQFSTPLANGTIQATTGTTVMCDILNVFSTGQIVCGGPPAPFQASLNVSLLHAIGRDNITTGGMELLDFPTIDPVVGNGTGERWNGFGLRGIDGDLTLIVPALSLNTTASVDFATSISWNSALMEKNVADPNTFAADNRRVQTSVWGQPEEVYYSPSAKELSYWQLADFSATTVDGLIVGMVDFTTALTAANVGPDANITNIVMTPARPRFNQSFTVTGNISSGTNATLEIILPGGGGSSATVPISAGAFSAVLTAPDRNDGTPHIFSSTEKEMGSFGIQITRTGGVLPPYNRKVATVRLDPTNSARTWQIYE